MPGRNRTRAARRNAERTSRNALARETAAELAESRPKLRRARTKTQLETLEARGAMSHEQHRAGARLARDYYASNTVIGRLVGRYEANLPKQPKKYQAAPDTPSAIVARERYDQAMKTVGPWLSGILVHVCITDEPASGWGPMNGKAATDGIALLRLGHVLKKMLELKPTLANRNPATSIIGICWIIRRNTALNHGRPSIVK
jgi:hypothetical protein